MSAAQTLRRRLRRAVDTYGRDLCLATSFGPQTIVLMHVLADLDRDATVFYLDTDLLFAETYALRDRLAARLGLRFQRVRAELSVERQAQRHGLALWRTDPDHCCRLRKVEPLRRFLRGRRAWITGVRRAQTPARRRARLVEWDAANGLVKLNPLLDWSDAEVWSYLREHDLPFNPLHLEGYPSIGCRPCTRPAAGDDPRSGRWSGRAKTECGIHGAVVPPLRPVPARTRGASP